MAVVRPGSGVFSMSLFAIGDFHLSFQVPDKSQDRFGSVWKNHEKKIQKNFRKYVTDQDTTVITGDHSWGRNLSQCEQDLEFIRSLPGRKILLRGNHDMFWEASKTGRLNELYNPKLWFLQNNFFVYKDYALVGTKGFTFEGPFYVDGTGRICGWDEEAKARAQKLTDREMKRLRSSFEAAVSAGYSRFIMFLHYPPTNILEQESPFTRIAQEYGVKTVVYSHCHGEARFHDSLLGEHGGIVYHLVSGDYLNFKPEKILP